MKNICLFFLLVTSGFAFSQKANHIEVFVNPFFQRFGDLTTQYTKVGHANFVVDHIKTPSVEVGFQFHHKFKGKWGYGIGSSWHYSSYQTYFFMGHPSFPSSKFKTTYRKTEIQSFSLRLGVTYQIVERIRLNAHLTAYVPYHEVNNSENYYEMTTFSNGLFYYNLKIIEPPYLSHPDLIPEISSTFEIVPNFNFTLGLRWKFWESGNDYHYQIQVVGSTEPENYGQKDLIFDYKENSRVLGYYFGLSYDLPLRKKKRQEKETE